MAVIVFIALVPVCGFFLYVLVQFWREEKRPRRGTGSSVEAEVIPVGERAKGERGIR
ncbi:MAG: hypothetical protein WA192_06945 [Candidatus Acidiferrales bacterium]